MNGVTTWVIRQSPDNRSYGAEIEAVVSPIGGAPAQGSATLLKAELGGGVDSLRAFRASGSAVVPNHLGNLAAIYSPPAAPDLQLRADWHWVGERFTESPLTRVDNTELPSYNYFNFGAGFAIPQRRRPDQPRSAERIPEQGSGGGQPAAGRRRRRADLPGPPAAAPPAAGVA